MLKLERGIRADSSQSASPQTTNTKIATPQQPLPERPLNQRPALGGGWSNPPIMPTENAPIAAIAMATVARETANAPFGYRESLAEAGQQARLPEQPAPAATQAPAAIQYAHPELARALSASTSRSILGIDPTVATPAAATNARSSSSPRDQRRYIFAGAIFGGIIILVAVLTIAALS